MKRLAAIGALSALGAAFLLAGPGARSGSADDSTRVDALFHNAANIVSGELVKIAGVPAGTVESVELTDDRLALVGMNVDAPFAPFRADARCEVRPQSLIGERFVQCDPGTAAAGPLADGPSGTPTVPADHNSAPIDLDLVFDVLRAPYRDRLAIVLNELGAGLTGRGEDLNAIIRSANPALADSRRVLDILNGQRAEIRSAIADTDRVLASVGAHPESVGRFIQGAADVSGRFGAHSDALGQSVARLPGLLAQAEPALRELDGLSVEALPVLQNLRRSAPPVRGLAGQLGPLARATRPTLARLGETAVLGRGALERSAPFADSLRRTLAGLRPLTPTLRELLSSLVARGGTEGLLRFFYNAALATSRFDGTSHIFPAHLVAGACGIYRTTDDPIEGCHGRFTGAVEPRSGKKHGKRVAPGAAVPFPGGPAPGPKPGQPTLPPLPHVPGPTLPVPPPSLPAPSPSQVNPLLDFLLGR